MIGVYRRAQAPVLLNIKFFNSLVLLSYKTILKILLTIYQVLFLSNFSSKILVHQTIPLKWIKLKTCILWSNYFRSDLDHKSKREGDKSNCNSVICLMTFQIPRIIT